MSILALDEISILFKCLNLFLVFCLINTLFFPKWILIHPIAIKCLNFQILVHLLW